MIQTPSARGRFAGAPTVLACLLCSAATLMPGAAWSQADAGSILRETQQAPRPVPPLPEIRAPKVLQDTGVQVRVTRFVVEGATSIPAAELEAALADRLNREWGFAGLQDAADAVAAAYRERGLHATAYLPEQSLDGGVLRIVVVEGRLGQLRIEAAAERDLPMSLLREMLSRGQRVGQVIDVRALATAARLVNEVPGVEAEVSLRAGERSGETDIVVLLQTRPALAASASLDNHDSRSTGQTRIGVNAQISNVLARGEDWQFNGQVTEGKVYGRLAGSWPLTAGGARLQWQASALRYELVDRFAASGARGTARTAALGVAQPVLRSATTTLTLTAEAEQRRLFNESAAGVLSDKDVRSLVLRASGDRSDDWQGGGVWTGSAALGVGDLDLGRNAADRAQDAAGPQREGRFAKLSGQLGRAQRVSKDGLVWVSTQVQVASRNLDSSEKMSLGGAYGVRAYPAQEASGDHGALVTAEYRHRLSDALQLAGFVDHGWVQRDHRAFGTGSEARSGSLSGVGASAEWRLHESTTARVTLAQRVGSNPWANADGTDSDGTRRRPQVWLHLQARF